MKDGHLNKCKECVKKDSKNNLKNRGIKYSGSYERTEKGVIRVIYKTQKSNSKRRGHNPPTYTKEELKEWLYKNGFKKLYDEWVSSGYDKIKKPSVDRIDDFKSYSFENIRLTTWGANKLHQVEDALSGKGTSGRKCKPVLQLKDGGLVAEYVSFSECRRVMGYSMEKTLKTGTVDRRGYSYQYKESMINRVANAE